MSNNVKCPYCDADIDTSDYYEIEDDESSSECPECEKEFHVKREIEIIYHVSRMECSDGIHEYGEWVRIDFDRDILRGWMNDPMMSKYTTDDTPYSVYRKKCGHCCHSDVTGHMPYKCEMPQSEIKSKWSQR